MNGSATRIEGAAMQETNAALNSARDCDDDFRAIMQAVRTVCPQTHRRLCDLALGEVVESHYVLGRENANAVMLRALQQNPGSQKPHRERARNADAALANLLGIEWDIEEDDETEDEE